MTVCLRLFRHPLTSFNIILCTFPEWNIIPIITRVIIANMALYPGNNALQMTFLPGYYSLLPAEYGADEHDMTGLPFFLIHESHGMIDVNPERFLMERSTRCRRHARTHPA